MSTSSVTRESSFTGSHFCERLVKEGYDVNFPDRLKLNTEDIRN